jgi:hypothetical protein
MAAVPTPVLVAMKTAFGFVRGQIISDPATIATITSTDAKHGFVRATHLVEAVVAPAPVQTEAEVVAAAVKTAVASVEATLHPAA